MTVLIVEDDLPAQRRLLRLLRTHPAYADTEILSAEDLSTARRILGMHAIQLLLLDLDLQGADGFDLVTTAVHASVRVIVVSANTHRAIEAFELGVADFVPKPVMEARLQLALARVQPEAVSGKCAELLVRTHSGLERILVRDIMHIQADDDYARLTLRSGRTFLHDEPIAALANRLPEEFVRVHRSHIVRREAILRVSDGSAGTRILHLSNSVQVPVSRRRNAEVMRLLFAAAER